MQFELTHTAGQNWASLKFSGKNSPDFFHSLFDSIKRIGGTCNGNVMNAWTVPSFITSQVIEEIIYNTCFACGGLMTNFLDIKTTNGKLKIRKCSQCEHSHT